MTPEMVATLDEQIAAFEAAAVVDRWREEHGLEPLRPKGEPMTLTILPEPPLGGLTGTEFANLPATTLRPPDPPDEIRPFPIPSLLAQVEAAVAAIPKDRHVAAILFADEQRVGSAIMARLGENWSFMAFADKPWKAKIRYGAAVEWAR